MRTPLFVYRLRKRLRGSNLVLLILSSGIVLIAAGGFALLDERGHDPSDDVGAPAAAETTNAAPVPPSVKQTGRMGATEAEVMRQKPDADLSSLSIMELPPPLLSIDGSGFRRGEETIRLDRVIGPRAGDVCLDGTQRWSCGLQARAALHNLVAGRSLFCQPRRALADGGIGADCRLDVKEALPAGDLAHLLVRHGWAQPASGHEAEFAVDLQQAREAGAGLWRGGWNISTPDRRRS